MQRFDLSKSKEYDGVYMFVDESYPKEVCVGEALIQFCDLIDEYLIKHDLYDEYHTAE